MKNVLFALLIATVATSCSKETARPVGSGNPSGPVTIPVNPSNMDYLTITNSILNQNGTLPLDLNADGMVDFTFQSTRTVDSAGMGTLHFTMSSKVGSMVLLNGNSPAVLFKPDVIPVFPSGHTWETATSAVVAKQVQPSDATPYWEGAWQDVTNGYVGIQVQKNNKVYNGWIKMTMDSTNKRLLLHSAAIAKSPYQDVKAGM